MVEEGRGTILLKFEVKVHICLVFYILGGRDKSTKLADPRVQFFFSFSCSCGKKLVEKKYVGVPTFGVVAPTPGNPGFTTDLTQTSSPIH